MAFLLTVIAGFSTLLGCLFINKKQDISFFLALSATIMLGTSLFDLIPNGYEYISNFKLLYLLIFFTLGGILTMLISSVLDNKNNIYKTGILAMIAIFLHNLPEGIITYIVATDNIKLGIDLAVSIALHNIPEGIAIAVPIYLVTKSKFKSFLYPLLASLAEPIGALFASVYFTNISNNILGLIFSLVAGIMFYIATYELYPVALNINKKNTIYGIFVGLLIIFVKNIFIF